MRTLFLTHHDVNQSCFLKARIAILQRTVDDLEAHLQVLEQSEQEFSDALGEERGRRSEDRVRLSVCTKKNIGGGLCLPSSLTFFRFNVVSTVVECIGCF